MNRTMQRFQMAPLLAVALMTRLQTHVENLATTIGGRVAGKGLEEAARYIEQELRSYGYSPQRQVFTAAGHTFANIEAESPRSAIPRQNPGRRRPLRHGQATFRVRTIMRAESLQHSN